MGIGLTDEVIDETSRVRFRQRLREQGLTSELFDLVVKHLNAAGLIVREGTLYAPDLIHARPFHKAATGGRVLGIPLRTN